MDLYALVDRLARSHSLAISEYEALIAGQTPELAAYLAEKAVQARRAVYGNAVFTRGLIEFSNVCKNDCLYCGLRRSNASCARYRLTDVEILSCCAQGYALGFRTFVLQSGEDPYFNDDRLCPLISEIKRRWPDCAVTLSLGERSDESYRRLYDAGADRYLLRHETATGAHYSMLHPPEMTLENRLRCLRVLREIGYQVGCGFMVGSPGQTAAHLAADLKFVEEFRPDMCGIGPFLPHHETPFHDQAPGTLAQTCYLLSILRLIRPNLLLPATTALGTVDPRGREKGILSGANVVMPNLSPVSVRDKYEIYDNKICTGEEAAECRDCLSARVRAIGYELVTDRGDPAPSASK